MIEVQLKSGEVISVDTDDPKKAAAAAKKFSSKQKGDVSVGEVKQAGQEIGAPPPPAPKFAPAKTSRGSLIGPPPVPTTAIEEQGVKISQGEVENRAAQIEGRSGVMGRVGKVYSTAKNRGSDVRGDFDLDIPRYPRTPGDFVINAPIEAFETLIRESAGVVGFAAGVGEGIIDEFVNPTLRNLGYAPAFEGKKFAKDMTAMALETPFVGTFGPSVAGARVSNRIARKVAAEAKMEKAFLKVLDKSLDKTVPNKRMRSGIRSSALNEFRARNEIGGRTKRSYRELKIAHKKLNIKERGMHPKIKRGTMTPRTEEAMFEILAEAGLTPQKLGGRDPRLVLMESLATRRILPTDLVGPINKNKLTMFELDTMLPHEISQVGRAHDRVQNMYGMIKRSKLALSSSRMNQGTGGYAYNSLSQAEKHMGFGRVMQAWGTFNTNRRLFMISQVATHMRNAFVGGGRVLMDSVSDLAEAGWRKSLNAVSPSGAVVKEAPFDSYFQTARWAFKSPNQKNRHVVRNLLSNMPDELNNIQARVMPDLDLALGVEKGMGPVRQTGIILNSLNFAQERMFRNLKFLASTEEMIRRKHPNLDPYAVIHGKKPLTNFISEKEIATAVDDAMEFTFASSPKEPVAKKIIEAINNTPLSFDIPFPRFLYNAAKFMYEWSPASAMKLLSPLERAAIARGDSQAVGKAITGTLMYAVGLQLATADLTAFGWRQSPDGPLVFEPVDKKTGEFDNSRKKVDISNLAPISTPIAVADWAMRNGLVTTELTAGVLPTIDTRTKEEKLASTTGEEKFQPKGESSFTTITDSIFGLPTRYGESLQIFDQILTATTDLSKPLNERLDVSAGSFTGDLISQFMTPLTQLRDISGDFMNEDRKVLHIRTNPLTEKPLSRLPGVIADPIRKALGTKKSLRRHPLVPHELERGGPLDSTVARQAFGVSVENQTSPLLREAARLGISYTEYYPFTGLREFDEVVAKHLAPMSKQTIDYMRTRDYQESTNDRGEFTGKRATDAEKGVRLGLQMSTNRTAAIIAAQAEAPELYQITQVQTGARLGNVPVRSRFDSLLDVIAHQSGGDFKTRRQEIDELLAKHELRKEVRDGKRLPRQ